MQLKFKLTDMNTGVNVNPSKYVIDPEQEGVLIRVLGGETLDHDAETSDIVIRVFTGLHDAAGSEIYEGDVLRLTEISGKQTLYVVISAAGCFWLTQQGCTSKQLLFYLIGKTAETNDGKGNIKKDIWEVVGNRWHPEFKGVFGDV